VYPVTPSYNQSPIWETLTKALCSSLSSYSRTHIGKTTSFLHSKLLCRRDMTETGRNITGTCKEFRWSRESEQPQRYLRNSLNPVHWKEQTNMWNEGSKMMTAPVDCHHRNNDVAGPHTLTQVHNRNISHLA
jgi:hypothetical protein